MDSPNTDDRRNFVTELITMVISGLVALGPLVIGLVAFFDPFRRKRTPALYQQGEEGAESEYLLVAQRDSLPANGLPKRFEVIADKIDAWNFIPAQPIGSVYLSLQSDDQGEKVLAFNTTCPHAGCSVAYEQTSKAYHCPCHNSSFEVNGERRDKPGKENPSPRDLDAMEVDQERFAKTGEVWIKFVNYYTGREHQEPKS